MSMSLRFENENSTEGRSTVWLILGVWHIDTPNLHNFAFDNLKVETTGKISVSLKLVEISEITLVHNANLVHESELKL